MKRYKLTELGKTLQFCFEQNTIQFLFTTKLNLEDRNNVERIKLLMGNVPEINNKIYAIIEYFKTCPNIDGVIIDKNIYTNTYFTSRFDFDEVRDITRYYNLKDILNERYFIPLY